jgi:histidinol-phosphate aminotransferase
MIRPPEYISSIRPYVPGKPVEEVERELGITGSVKLASNENPMGPSPMAIRVIEKASSGLNRYPDSGGYYLTKRLSEIHGIGEDQIILGNGSNEILNVIACTYLTDRDSAVMAAPSFIIYHLATQSVGARTVQVPLTEFRHDLERMAKAITKDTKVVFIANPNNPTGTINTGDEFAEFMDRVPDDVLVVVDEAYFEYVKDTNYPDSMKYLKDGKDIIILRTFSKIYGLAGLRIGYGISKKEIISELNKVRAPFNTNSVAQVAATKALDDKEHVVRSVNMNEEGKSFLYEQLTELGIDFVQTEANFIYIVLKDNSSKELFDKLLAKGIIVRPMGEDTIRVTIGLADENKKFIDGMREVI